jgi:hypothetical protein
VQSPKRFRPNDLFFIFFPAVLVQHRRLVMPRWQQLSNKGDQEGQFGRVPVNGPDVCGVIRDREISTPAISLPHSAAFFQLRWISPTPSRTRRSATTATAPQNCCVLNARCSGDGHILLVHFVESMRTSSRYQVGQT